MASGNGSKRKRSYPHGYGSVTPLLSGVAPTLEDKDNDFVCPICFNLLKEAHITRCGHTFCHECILKCFETSSRCPKCNCDLENRAGDIFPNFLLNELVAKHKIKIEAIEGATAFNTAGPGGATDEKSQEILNKVLDPSSRLSLTECEYMINALSQRKDELLNQSLMVEYKLLREFLTQLKRIKDDELIRIKRETSVIQDDLNMVENLLENLQQMKIVEGDQDNKDNSNDQDKAAIVPSIVKTEGSEGFNLYKRKDESLEEVMSIRRKHMQRHYDDLTNCYFSNRVQKVLFPPETTQTPDEDNEGFYEFSSSLNNFTRYSGLRHLATLSYTTDMFNNASIVSSIEFDKNQEMFAIAGVTKRIKIYNYNTVLKDTVDIHYPCVEMVCGSKISCVAWSAFHQNTLASSDYDCTVIVWDALTASKVKTFQEHEKRCWSVDFNQVNTKLLASGSDDTKVKLWSTDIQHSVASLEAKANVCCVKFNPSSCYHLAFGSADHCVHYYDLRHTKNPLNVFKGHKKAVSYVKFLNKETVVSASTDSQLKLWNVNNRHCLRSFVGHVNEKNFVGLATNGDYITCGSENNGLYVYYKGLSKPLFNYKFEPMRSLLDRGDRRDNEDSNEFVSAVCWRQQCPVIVAANSQGTIKILELN